MSKVQQKSSEKLAVPQYQMHTSTKNEVSEENQVYVAQLQELAGVFSSAGNQHIRQYCINIVKEIIARADDEESVAIYVKDMMS